MSQIIADYDVKARYKDSNGEIRIVNRRSKKGGENLRRTSAAMDAVNFRVWLEGMQAKAIQSLYDKGVYDHLISNQRKSYLQSDGNVGISKHEALERYKWIYAFLSDEQLKNRNKTFDNFTDQELGVLSNESTND